MSWMDKMERKWGRHAVANLSRYFVFAQIIGLFVTLVASGLMNYMSFSVRGILHGQIWRLLTWIFTPTASLDIFGILFLYCVFSWGSSLEYMLGTFRMNVFLWGSVILCDAAGFLVYFITRITVGTGYSPSLSTYYILMSMLLALAMCMPEGEVRLYFVLPIKMKWMLIFELAYLGYQVIRIFSVSISQFGKETGILCGVLNCVQIVVPVINMFWFFYASKTRLSGKQERRQKEFRAQFSEPRPGSGIAKHKCAICGRTEITNPELQFRYCSKCKGNMEYCQEHLFTHQHVQ